MHITSNVTDIVDRGLAEDVGQGDWTTLATAPEGARGRGRIVAKSDCVLAGLPVAHLVWERLGNRVTIEPLAQEGAELEKGQLVCRLEGDFRHILMGERLALNLLQRMSGIATATRRMVAMVSGTKARIADTRKTVPGLRALDKYAVRVGGGWNHRAALDGGVLIKENHIAAAGSITEAVVAARRTAPLTLRIEVETQDLADVREAVDAGADIVMLDNMSYADMRQAVSEVGGRVLLEASGNVTADRVRAVDESGVDIISVGALTHSVVAADLSLLVERAPAP